MRKLSLMMFAVTALGIIGCGRKNGPAEPAKLSAEQIEAGNKDQKKADDEEAAHRKADPGNKKGFTNSVDEEERRSRGR